MGHPEDVIPFCIRSYKIKDSEGKLLFEKFDNHQTINRWIPDNELITNCLHFEFEHPVKNVPVSIFEIYID
jgi:hypothetical protein